MSAAFKIHDLRCFMAVAAHGSFQAAAAALHRTHPSVFAAVGRLEEQLGLSLLDRHAFFQSTNRSHVTCGAILIARHFHSGPIKKRGFAE